MENGEWRMSVLFVHDIKFRKDKFNNLFTNRSYNNEVWERYLKLDDELNVIGKLEHTEYSKEYSEKNFNEFNKSRLNARIAPEKKIIQLFKFIRSEVLKNDYIIVRLPSLYGYIAIHYAKKYKKPYLLEVVGCTLDSLMNHSLKGKILAYPSFFIMKNSVKNSPFTIYVTEKYLQKKYPSNGITTNCSNVILSNVDTFILEDRIKSIEELRQGKKITLGTIGALDVRYKGQRYVIEAISKLNNMGLTNIEYRMLGQGNDNNLKSMAEKLGVSNSVFFDGTLPTQEVFGWLENIDIYIQPSATEGLPRGLIEAMSCGIPSIGSNVGGIPELLDEDSLIDNRGKNVTRIIEILKSYNLDKMKSNSLRNFAVAKRYQKEIIEERRNAFLLNFINEFKSINN